MWYFTFCNHKRETTVWIFCKLINLWKYIEKSVWLAQQKIFGTVINFCWLDSSNQMFYCPKQLPQLFYHFFTITCSSQRFLLILIFFRKVQFACLVMEKKKKSPHTSMFQICRTTRFSSCIFPLSSRARRIDEDWRKM